LFKIEYLEKHRANNTIHTGILNGMAKGSKKIEWGKKKRERKAAPS
jgi:hypothetical protein